MGQAGGGDAHGSSLWCSRPGGFHFCRPISFFFFFFTHPKVLAVIPNPSVDQPNRPAARSLGFTKFG